jgi:gamma-glutamylcyclotransferase (GGCT)/AIG2-like uncharacterized protein YtfP
MLIKVAVYGTLRKNQGNHRLLVDSKFLGEGTTGGIMYSMGGFPAVDITGDKEIKIEVYSVDEQTLNRLDGLEGYPHFYNRSEIKTPYGAAWIYHIDKKELLNYPLIQSGDWVEYRSKRAA